MSKFYKELQSLRKTIEENKIVVNEDSDFVDRYGSPEEIIRDAFSSKFLRYVKNYHLSKLPIHKIEDFDDLEYFLNSYGIDLYEVARHFISMKENGQWGFEPEE